MSRRTPNSQAEPHLHNEVNAEEFDLLVVASGYFSRPYIPEIPGLKGFSGVLHSSEVQKGNGLIEGGSDISRGDIVVIGGSMSGVEAASTAAMHQSSHLLANNLNPRDTKNVKVHHIHSRPFWTIPTYIPHESPDNVSFLPLDLAMYDLGRRPAGPIDYTIGPVPKERVAKSNEYFRSLLGAEYEQFGHLYQPETVDDDKICPPWVGIGNDYANFVRTGAIKTTMGRAVGVVSHPETGLATVNIETADGHSESLKNVTTVVMATGFTPFESLSFLPKDILATLEYSSEDPFLPLILDKGGTIRSEIPDLGFCGYYRGPYWGAMEMQARFLGDFWSKGNTEGSTQSLEMGNIRILREPKGRASRSQFPMGDYVGLMESFSRDLGITRTELSEDNGRTGPVIPARYSTAQPPTSPPSVIHSSIESEVQNTLDALNAMSHPENPALKVARGEVIFRALQGTWQAFQLLANGEKASSGSIHFHPRFPSSPGYGREYVCEEQLDAEGDGKWYVVRLVDDTASQSTGLIEVWSASSQGMVAKELDHMLDLSPFVFKEERGERVSGEYVAYANTPQPRGPNYDTADSSTSLKCQYTFNLQAVSITAWERLDHVGRNGQGIQSGQNHFIFER